LLDINIYGQNVQSMSELLDHRYQVVRVLGAGGFGETFLAEDTKMPSRRLCVIKQLKQMTHNPAVYQIAKERFYREAVVLEELGDTSDRIPKLYGHFEQDERFYLVQEWIEGQTLQQKIEAEGTVSEAETKRILVSILQALAQVHDRGIIHRDLKPENIIIRDRDRQTVLIDFGAVKEILSTALNPTNNSVSIVIGTPGYMPSEQAAGRPFFASDVYSVGLTAIYMLTGKQPAQLDHDPRTDEIEWRSDCPHVSHELAQVIDKASRFHPRDRYSNAAEMLDALQTSSQPVAVTINMSAPHPNPPHIAPPNPTNSSSMPTIQAAPPASYAPTTTAHPDRNKLNQHEQREQRSTADAFIVIGLVLACIAGVAGIGYYVVDAIANRTADPNPPIVTPPTAPPNDSLATDPDGFTEPDEFYFLADSAYRDAENAKQRYELLRSQGYENAGTFWVPDYANLNGVEYIQVYADRYDAAGARSRCRTLLAEHGQVIEDAYCALASKDANTGIDRILASEVVPKPEPPAIPASDPQEAVRDYYDLINIREYELAQGRLSEDFKEGAIYGNEEQFLGWWNSVDRVVVTGTRTTKQSPRKATVETQLVYYMKDGGNSPESLRIKLKWDKQMKWWLIDETERF
jgi:serine/threonine-protein kinase